MRRIPLYAAAFFLAAGSAVPLEAQDRISVGQTVRGTLTSSSPQLDDGSHYQLYVFEGQAGQTVTITLRSNDFDAYLSLFRLVGDGEFVASDDDSAGGTDARVVATLPASGEYLIRANSLFGGETGGFSLELSGSGGEQRGGKQGGGGAPAMTSDLVTLLLDSATVLMRSGGLAPLAADLRGAIAPGSVQELTIDLPTASIAAVLGVCDEQCSDVDLVVFGPDGREIGSDFLPDDAPIVQINGVLPGRYRVRVSMPGCSAERCGFGVRVFGS